MLLKAYRIRNDSCITCLYAVHSRQPGGGRCCSSDISFGFLKEASTCRIETPFAVAFDAPLGPLPDLVELFQGRVASPFRSASVAMFGAWWCIGGFQEGAYDVLHHFLR